MILGVPGEPLLLELVLADEAAGLFPQVTIYDEAGAIEAGPLDLADRGGGLYQVEWAAPVVGQFSAVFLTYSDAAHTTRTDHEPGLDHLRIEDWSSIADAVLDEDLSTHVTLGSNGLAQVLQHYAGAIHIDTGSGLPGTSYPRGTEEYPVSNLADALILANNYGIRRFRLRGSITLTTALPDWVIEGSGEEAELNFGNQDVADSEFRNLLVTGSIANGPVRLEACDLDGVGGIEGTAVDCVLLAGQIDMAGNLRFIGSASGVPGLDTPAISVGTGNNLELRGHRGGVEIRDLDGAADRVSIDMVAGQVVLGASCTAGTVTIRGTGNLTDNSAGTTIEREAFLNLPTIADRVLEEAIQDHLSSGSLGEAIRLIMAHAGVNVRDQVLTADADGRPLTVRRRVYDNATDADLDQNHRFELTVDATYAGNANHTLIRLFS